MPWGIVWFKIHLGYKLQQMAVGRFEVEFYSNSPFKQLFFFFFPSSFLIMQASGKNVKMTKEAELFFCVVLVCSFK